MLGIDPRRASRIALVTALSAAGLASGVAVFTPSAASRTNDDCTVVCLPTTSLPTLPTTVPTLPTVPLPTSTTTTAPPPQTTTVVTTVSTTTTTTTTSDPPTSASALAVSGLRVSVAGKGKRRSLVVRLVATKPVKAKVWLLRGRKAGFTRGYVLWSGLNVRRSRLPGTLRAGRYAVRLSFRDANGASLTVRKTVSVPR